MKNYKKYLRYFTNLALILNETICIILIAISQLRQDDSYTLGVQWQ